MCFFVKYGTWQVAAYDEGAAARLEAGGFSPLTAAVLCSRGYDTPEAARAFLRADLPLPDPFLLRDMDKVVERVRRALERRERIVVFGDYDVDGITATTLLTDYLRSRGGDCIPYIPSRLEEGYGLNEPAIRALREKGAALILTVDCGITALEEARLCRRPRHRHRGRRHAPPRREPRLRDEGPRALQAPVRPGLRALMEECGCLGQAVAHLFLTEDPARAASLAQQLCQLNRRRQAVETAIYQSAVAKLPPREKPAAIVLSDPAWHQGVVGIVASRLAEEYRCPTFLICPDGSLGKASSRSYGGFNLFSALEALSPLLENYGGHELAAGFTIRCGCIDRFREEITRLSRDFQASGAYRSALEIDCAVTPELLTLQNVAALDELEPCGAGCPRPVFFLDGLTVDQLSEVRGGERLRLRLSRDGVSLSAIFFSTTALRASVALGDTVEIAFTPQINEFRGVRSVQLSLVDIRPGCVHRTLCRDDETLYLRHLGGALRPGEAADLLPARKEFVALWRYLVARRGGVVDDTCTCLSRKVSRYAGTPCRPGRTRICLDVFHELGLLSLSEHQRLLHITLTSDGRKVDLDQSAIIRRLKEQKAGD